MVLLVVDTQKLMTRASLYRFETFCANVRRLIDTARRNGIEVIYVRHDDGVGENLTRGTDGFEIACEFAPAKGERIFDKTVNSPFYDSGLLEYLAQKSEKQIVVAGLQTEYCIDATVKCGFEHGFEMIVPAYANSTFDNPHLSAEKTYHYYNEFIWTDRYARCLTMEETMKLMTGIA